MKIGIFGAIGVDDIGDVVMLEAALYHLKEIGRIKKTIIEFVVFSLNVTKTKEQLKKIGIDAEVIPCLEANNLSKNILNSSFEELLNNNNLRAMFCNEDYYNKFFQCNGLFFIGGGYFNSYWGQKLISCFIIPLALGYQLNKPIYISGVNLGPFSEEEIEKYKGLFKRVNVIILRDRKPSIIALEKLGGTEGRLILGSDDVLPAWYDERKYFKSHQGFNTNYAILQLHHWVEKYSQNYIEFYKTLASFFNELIDNKYVDKVYFVPFTYFRGADYECGRRLKTFMNDREEYEVLNPTDDHIFMRELIKNSKFVIASRYHPIVFGLGEHVPTLGIYVNDLYYLKISGAYDVVKSDKKKNMVYINDVTFEKLMNWFKTLNHSDNLEDYKNRTEIIKKYAFNKNKSMERFIELMRM